VNPGESYRGSNSAAAYSAYKSECIKLFKFESVEQLEELLNALLNEGGLIIKWGRKIKNKGNAVYSI
jgi:hypothetical protein